MAEWTLIGPEHRQIGKTSDLFLVPVDFVQIIRPTDLKSPWFVIFDSNLAHSGPNLINLIPGMSNLLIFTFLYYEERK